MSVDSEKIKQLIAEAVEAKVKEIKLAMVPHTCFTCRWFVLREEKPRNRVCRCPTELVVEKGRCRSWKIQPNPSEWVHSKNMSM